MWAKNIYPKAQWGVGQQINLSSIGDKLNHRKLYFELITTVVYIQQNFPYTDYIKVQATPSK